MLVVDESQSGTSIELPQGEVLAVRLKENPGTGYRWSVENAGDLQPLDDSYHAVSAPGAAGCHEFRFRASRPGTHELRLKHWRDWQGEASVIDRFGINVRVS